MVSLPEYVGQPCAVFEKYYYELGKEQSIRVETGDFEQLESIPFRLEEDTISFGQKADQLYLLMAERVQKVLLPSFTTTSYPGRFSHICILEEPVFIKDSSAAFKLEK